MKVFMSTRHLLSLLIAMTFSLSAFAQDLTVTGTVYDETGEPLIGASVQPKGTNVGVMTDIDGNYTIKVASNATLNFSYIGCVPQAIAVEGRTKIDVTLKNDSQVLDEVVAIGYGTVKKKDLTGAVSTVSGADLAKVPVSSAAQALQGKASGLNIVSQSGAPGAKFNVTLRGGASITQDTEPLYVVDGFVMSNALTNIDINDIESIDVLKDASATAIYGARGSNGIIVITTKKASKGVTRVDYNGYVSFDTLSKKLKMMSNPVDYVNYQYEMAEMQSKTSLWAVGYDNAKGVDEDDFYSGVYGRIYDNYANSYAEDWQDLTFGGHATTQSHNVSITTGSDKIQALVSYNYTDQDGLLANHDYKRNSVRSKINAELWKGIKFDFGAFYYENITHGGGAYSGMKNVLLQPINGGTMFTRDQLVNTQTFPTYRGLDNGYDTANPLVQNLASTSESMSRRFEAQAGITLDLVKNFVWRTAYHYTTNWGKSTSFADENSTSYLVDQVNTGMNGGISNSEGSSWGITNTLTYSNTFAQKHDVTFMLGQEYSSSESTSNKMTLIQFPYPNHKLDDISVATVSSKSSGHSHGNMLSFFARANYGYDDRYLLTATFRADGSSKFAKGNKWGFFPSASGAWRVSQEKFWQESGVNDWFNNLKLRVGYGVTGNNSIGSNLYVTNATMTSYPMDNNENSPAYVLGNTLGNAKLKWETLHATNIGLDLGFLNNRIMLTVEWYNNQISDMLMNCVIPSSTGYTRQYQNVGSMRNRGWEISLNTVNITNRDFQWTSVLNLGFNKSKVISLEGDEDHKTFSAGGNRSGTVAYYAVVGESLGDMYGYKYDGIYTTADFNEDGSLKDGVVRPYDGTPEPGDIKFAADNYEYMQDGKYFDAEGNEVSPQFTRKNVKIGNGTPNCIGGFGNTFTFKGFDLNVFMNFSIGNDVYNATKHSMSPYAPYQNVPTEFGNNYYRTIDPTTGRKAESMAILQQLNPNENLRTWSLSKTNSDYITYPSSYYVEDGSYLRLSQVTLGYTFPQKWMSKAHISKLRIYFTANNLCTITGYDGYDPEASSKNDDVVCTPGYDSSTYPRSRSYVVGLNLSF